MRKSFVTLTTLTTFVGLLNACGGSGSSGASTTVTAAQTPTVQINETEKLLREGLFRVSYGAGSINGVADQAIYSTHIDPFSLKNGHFAVSSEFYTGLKSWRWSVFEEITDITKGTVPSSSSVMYSRVGQASIKDSLTFDLDIGKLSETGNTLAEIDPFNTWKVSIMPVTLDGQAIREFLKTNLSMTKPDPNVQLVGNFPIGSRSFTFSFESKNDVIYSVRRFSPYGKADFLKTTFCGRKDLDGSRLNLQFQSDGKINIFQEAAAVCSGDKPGTLIGTGNWTDETISGESYTFFRFPTNVPVSRYNNTFDQTSYDSGVRIGVRWSGLEYDVFQIPKGGKIVKTSLAINKVAADAIKLSAGWK